MYKHKLNMLEPGSKMLAIAAALSGAALVLYYFKLFIVAYVLAGLAGLIFLVLIILLMIESHQDKVLNEAAIREDKEKEERSVRE
ncbi:MAG: hypothetical protein IKZ29_03260 [Clostridiales bacterium]|nr:hypothetical protein [Clostridiales bacterium]MBR4947563.1 hypothetical protein [Clostridiales bacterium]